MDLKEEDILGAAIAKHWYYRSKAAALRRAVRYGAYSFNAVERILAVQARPKTVLESLAEQDCVLIATDHSAYDYDFIVRHAQLVVDTRNATRGVTAGREKVLKA